MLPTASGGVAFVEGHEADQNQQRRLDEQTDPDRMLLPFGMYAVQRERGMVEALHGCRGRRTGRPGHDVGSVAILIAMLEHATINAIDLMRVLNP